MRPADRRRRSTDPLVAMARHPVGRLARAWLDFEVFGRQHLPRGAHVLAANHYSFVDPVLVTLAEGRNVRYLAAAELFDKHPAFDRLISFFGAIPTHKDRPPIRAIRAALGELARGRPVGVFPEGRRVTRWGDAPPMRGAAWLALRAGVPVVPVAILGADATLSPRNPGIHRATVRMWVEPPIDVGRFRHHPDPVTAVGEAWVAAIGRRLDPWADGPDPLG